MHPLSVHYALAMAVVASAVLLVWWRWGRRVLLYLLTIHIAVGLWVIVSGLSAPSLHYAFAVLAFIGYMVANAIGRRPGRENLALGISIAASVCVLTAFSIGQWAVKG